jgi:hypothetical protein
MEVPERIVQFVYQPHANKPRNESRKVACSVTENGSGQLHALALHS